MSMELVGDAGIKVGDAGIKVTLYSSIFTFNCATENRTRKIDNSIMGIHVNFVFIN